MTDQVLRSAVVRGLLAGLGVEDIAVTGKFNVENVRFEVRRLRANGTLPLIVAQARERTEA